MSDYVKCKICDKWGYKNSHKCPPVWEVRMYERRWEEDWVEVYATDAEDAATTFAEQSDRGGDYDIIRRGSAEVEVRKQGETEVTQWDIQAESVPEYTAWEATRAVPSEQRG